MYTIRRTATIVTVAAGLAVASTGLAFAADGGSTGTARTATTASPAEADITSSATGVAPDGAGSTTVRVESQSSTSASTQIDSSTPDSPARADTVGGAWCGAYRLVVAVGGDSWFGTVNVKGLCEQMQP